MNNLLIIILVLFLTSCTIREDEKSFNELYWTINTDHEVFIGEFKYSDIFDDFFLVPLEFNQESTIGFIKQIKIFDAHIFILDMMGMKVLHFSIDGKHKNNIGRVGRGPGEYIHPSSFAYTDKDEILVYCRVLKKIVFYNFNGKFQKEIFFDKNLNTMFIEYNNGLIYLIDTPYPGEKDDRSLFKAYDREGNLINEWMKNRGIFMTNSFGPEGTIIKTNDEIVFYESYLDTMYKITNNTLIPYIATVSNNSISHKELQDLELGNGTFAEKSDKMRVIEKVWARFNYLENNTILHFKYKKGQQYYDNIYRKKDSVVYKGYWKDDLTLNANQWFFTSIEGYFVGVLLNNFIMDHRGFQKAVKDGKIKMNIQEEELDRIFDNNDNPVLIFYRIKD